MQAKARHALREEGMTKNTNNIATVTFLMFANEVNQMIY